MSIPCKMRPVGYPSLPAGYTKLAYLTSNNSKQHGYGAYISSDVILTSEHEVECEYAYGYDKSQTALFGGNNASNTKMFTYWPQGELVDGEVIPNLICFWNNAKMYPIVNIHQEKKKRKIKVSKGVFELDGEVIAQTSQGAFNTGVKMAIFARRTGTNVFTSWERYSTLDIYSFSVEKNGEKVANFIPALDSTGTPCMYDIVSHKPYYSAGNVDFTYPTDSAPVMMLALDEKFYAKLTEHGVRRLYKVPEGCTLSKDEYAAQHGFKELIEPPAPQTGYWTTVWKETDTQLICEWVETEPPTEVTENN